MHKITVIDSLMGQGKTTWAAQYMDNHQEKKFLYITPYISEDEAMINERLTNREVIENFRMPIHGTNGKLDNLNYLLEHGYNIASTHQLFKYLNEESRLHIIEKGYVLILDEVLDVVEKKVIVKDKKNVTKGSLLLLKKSGCITVDDDCFVHWHDELEGEDTPFSDIKDLAQKQQLLLIDGEFFMWQYPPDIFTIFRKIFVMTYMFEASPMYAYFNLQKLDYEIKSIDNTYAERELVDYFEPDLSSVKSLIDIYDGKLNDGFATRNGQYTLSKSWFKANSGKDGKVKMLKNNVMNFFKNIMKAKSNDFMWSTFKEDASKLDGKGYTYTDTENHPEKENKTFVPCNARGTNKFAHKHILAYCLNVFLPPEVTKYFNTRSNGEITMNEDKYALSQLIQWIWRSAIRNGEKIFIYIPSVRMRMLLKQWLGYFDNPEVSDD